MYRMLRSLRDLYPRVIWIDSICIYQQNDSEKSKQVLLMRDIYQQGRRRENLDRRELPLQYRELQQQHVNSALESIDQTHSRRTLSPCEHIPYLFHCSKRITLLLSCTDICQDRLTSAG
jgi:hypothetical protein